MDRLVEKIPSKTNKYFFFGDIQKDYIHEQQLSGHSWYLRGLLAYYELYGNSDALKFAQSTVENLYLPTKGKFCGYPTDFIKKGGDVSGNSTEIVNGWLLSTDTGCAFMSIDGLSHYYAVTRDERVLKLLYEMRETFEKIDKIAIKAQTHCCLTAARGFIRIYNITSDKMFLNSAKKLWDLYATHGMTYTYQNFNWWGKGDTWAEPCAIVDSLILAGELFKITNDETYRVMAARIWHNGFSAMQVGNGGAGPTTTVSDTEPILKTAMYEAPFCCTMRLAEGLLYAKRNKEILYAVTDDVKKDNVGRYMLGDIIYAEVTCSEETEKYIDRSEEITVDNIRLIPIVKYYNLPKTLTESINQKIIFRGVGNGCK